MKEKILKLAETEIRAPYAEEVKKLLRPYIRVYTKKNDNDTLDIGKSKIGGLPDLPKGIDWPYSEEDNQHMHFIAQFKLDEVAEYDKEHLLPKTGYLFFFACYSEIGKVIYFEGKEKELEKKEIPETLKPKEPSFWKKIFKIKPAKMVYDECQVNFEKQYSIPSWDSVYADIVQKEKSIELKPVDAYSEKYLNEDVIIRKAEENVTNHHFLGYADGIQDSFQEIHVNIEPDFNWENITIDQYKDFSKWILLLQLDTDPNADMMWGDAGRLYYMIQKEDLKNHKFDKIKATMDCY